MPILTPLRSHAKVAILATVPMLVLPFVRVAGAENYKYASLFLVPMLWGVYAVRRRLHLDAFHFALFALAMLLHNLGAFGFYTREFGGLSFDTYVHFYFGFVGGWILERGFRLEFGWSSKLLWIAVPVFLLGLGAIHELVELASTLGLGKDVGMYKVGNADEFDTHKDLLNNLLGCLVALALLAIDGRRRRPASISGGDP